MRASEIKVGGLYVATVNKRQVNVRIDSQHSRGGWNGTNTANGKLIRFSDARRFRFRLGGKKRARSPLTGPGSEKQRSASMLDAAAIVLAKCGKPMRSQELIDTMAQRKLWSSPTGQTPAATLSSAISREITHNKAGTRFKRIRPGLFAFAG